MDVAEATACWERGYKEGLAYGRASTVEFISRLLEGSASVIELQGDSDLAEKFRVISATISKTVGALDAASNNG